LAGCFVSADTTAFLHTTSYYSYICVLTNYFLLSPFIFAGLETQPRDVVMTALFVIWTLYATVDHLIAYPDVVEETPWLRALFDRFRDKRKSVSSSKDD
jgi:hypothetical protein